MGRAVIYTRVSTRAQEDGYSLDAQEKDSRQYCEGKHTIVAVKSDTFSGHDTMDERVGMQAAVDLIQQGIADTLVIWRIDRSNRFMVDNLLLLRMVSDAGGSFESVTEGAIPNTPVGKLLLSVHSFAGESEWEAIRERTQRGLTERIAKGYILTSAVPLYGYMYAGDKKETYVIDPESGQVVRDIFDKADQGWPTRRICRWLQDEGIPTPSMLLYQRGQLPKKRKIAKEWGRSAVADILTDESYTGKHVVRRLESYKAKVKTEDGQVKTVTRRRVRPEGDDKRVVVDIPAIVSAEQFARVQELVKSRQRDIDMDDPPLLNRGFAVCGVCGHTMIATRHPNAKYRIYVCSQRRSNSVHKTDVCPGAGFAVRSEQVDADIWERVKDIIRDAPKFQRLVQGKSEKLSEQQADAARRAEMEAAELADARTQQATVYSRMASETDDTIYAMHRAELQRLNETVAALEKRVAESQGRANSAQKAVDTHKALMDYVRASVMMTQAVPERMERWRAAVEPVTSDPTAAERLLKVLPDVVDEISLDNLDRESRRGILRTLGVKVPMYPQKSEFAATHEHRWDMTFVASVDDTCLQVTPWSAPSSAVTRVRPSRPCFAAT